MARCSVKPTQLGFDLDVERTLAHAAKLGTVYALSSVDNELAAQLSPILAQGWSLAAAFSLLAWYVFAPQCISTLAITRRETNSWRYPLIMAAYLFALAYLAAFVTYRIALLLT